MNSTRIELCGGPGDGRRHYVGSDVLRLGIPTHNSIVYYRPTRRKTKDGLRIWQPKQQAGASDAAAD